MGSGIKWITETGRDGWVTVSEYYPDGYLVREPRLQKKEMRNEEQVTYKFANDTLSIIFGFMSGETYTRSYKYSPVEGHFTGRLDNPTKYYHDKGLLTCAESTDELRELSFYFYDDNRRLVREETFSDIFGDEHRIVVQISEYSYNRRGNIKKFTSANYNLNSDMGWPEIPRGTREPIALSSLTATGSGIMFLGVVCYDRKCNSYGYRYTRFDKHGNWRKSYSVTKWGLLLSRKRRIEYR